MVFSAFAFAIMSSVLLPTHNAHAAAKKDNKSKCPAIIGELENPKAKPKNKVAVKAEPKKETTALALPKGQTLTVENSQEPKFHEFTFIRDGSIHAPYSQVIPPQYFGDRSFTQELGEGDKVSLTIYPGTTPLYQTKEIQRIEDSSSHSSRTYSHTVRSTSQMPVLNNKTVDDYSAAALWVETNFGDRNLNQGEKDLVIRNILNDANLLRDAVTYANSKSTNSSEHNLTNFDNKRFFWFIPKDRSELTAARVLDIHRYAEKKGYTILIEYMSSELNPGFRSRVVAELTEAELKTIVIDDNIYGNHTRTTSQQAYVDSLTPLEVQTKAFAKSLGLNLFGYGNDRRHPNQKTDVNSWTALQMLNALTWLPVLESVKNYWGHLLNDLKNKEELGKSEMDVNIIDLFSRLNPNYVLDHFNSESFQYIWVITEDGQLKICPKFKIQGAKYFRTPVIRLASGRKIYAGGDFTINLDGTLNIEVGNEYYRGGAWTDSTMEFVTAVFLAQASAKVAGYDTIYKSIRTDDFIKTAKAQAANTSEKLSWDLEKGAPLDFKEWLKFSKIQEPRPFSEEFEQLNLTWAHYVLKTNNNLSFGEIKSAYKKLNAKFHPDRNKDGEEIQKNINQAYDAIKEDAKKDGVNI